MLEPVVGSLSCERVLIFLAARGEGYPRGIAAFYETALGPVQKQLEKLEAGGIIVSRDAGRTRLYTFNPRYPFLAELRGLLDKAISFYPDEFRQELQMNRRRPRRKGKPL
jgi:hypothetical protein